nr:pseudouridine synthase [Endozoicomonas sp. YOMI1]
MDKPTPGVLVFALSSEVAKLAGEQFQEGRISKTYYAIVRGYAPECGPITVALF